MTTGRTARDPGYAPPRARDPREAPHQPADAFGVRQMISAMRRLRQGLDAGLELPEALARAAAALPRDARRQMLRAARRLEGDYPEDEWGFDEDFAELVEPFFRFLYDRW